MLNVPHPQPRNHRFRLLGKSDDGLSFKVSNSAHLNVSPNKIKGLVEYDAGATLKVERDDWGEAVV